MDYLNFCKSYFSATSIPVNLLDNVNILYSSVRTVTNIPHIMTIMSRMIFQTSPVLVTMILRSSMALSASKTLPYTS